MLNAYSLGFVCVAATAVAGVDYYTQTAKNDLAFGELSVSDYVGSFSSRMSEASEDKRAEKAEKERQAAWRRGALEYLPEAPEGWTRRTLTEGDNAAVMPYVAESKKKNAGASLLTQMQAREKKAEERKRAERSFVYENGSETVFVEIKLYERPSSNSMIGLVAATIDGVSFGMDSSERGYAVLGGVGYIEKFNYEGKRPHHFRVLNATLGFGHEAQILVHANASSESTRQILASIDYDGLNKLLPRPLPSVGNDVVLAENLDEVVVAKAMSDMRAEFLNLRAMEAQSRMANLDATAMIVNTYAQGYGGGGLLDITGGKQMDLNGLIDAGYATAIAALMEGKSAAEISADVGKVVDAAMAFADAEAAANAAAAAQKQKDAPGMSPELQRELNGHTDSKNTSGDNAIAALAAGANDASTSASRSPGAVMMEIDQPASDAAEDMIYSKPVDPAELDSFMNRRGSSPAEVELGFILAARLFEGKHGLAEESCEYVSARYRLECADIKAKEASGGMAALISRLKGEKAAEAQAQAQPLQQKDAAKPSRLKLSNGTNGGKRCVGSFCN